MSVVDDYLKARANFDQVSREIAAVVVQLGEVASSLRQQPGETIFSNFDMVLPAEASMTHRSKSFDANNWPDPKKIMGLLKRWHETKSETKNAWNLIQPSMRGGLVPPNFDPPSDAYPRR